MVLPSDRNHIGWNVEKGDGMSMAKMNCMMES